LMFQKSHGLIGRMEIQIFSSFIRFSFRMKRRTDLKSDKHCSWSSRCKSEVHRK
jgi:hypothetical protein